MRPFDRKFGAAFLDRVPAAPGVYRLLDEAGALLYVGKAGNLRRRLGQYRVTTRRKRDRKRRALVRAAASITWEVCESPLAAALTEVRLIQSLRPRRNVASAFPFLYPFVGVHEDGPETYFCLTTAPAAFPAFAFHGAYRSRLVTREALYALGRLLRFVGHPVHRIGAGASARHDTRVSWASGGFRGARPRRGTPFSAASRARRWRVSRWRSWIIPRRRRAAWRSGKTSTPWPASSTWRRSCSPGPGRPRATRRIRCRRPSAIRSSCLHGSAGLPMGRPAQRCRARPSG